MLCRKGLKAKYSVPAWENRMYSDSCKSSSPSSSQAGVGEDASCLSTSPCEMLPGL